MPNQGFGGSVNSNPLAGATMKRDNLFNAFNAGGVTNEVDMRQ